MSEHMITVTQVKSGAHAKPKTRGTLRALGLGRIGKTNTLPDRPEIRGMIRRVPHLVTVSSATDENVTEENVTEENVTEENVTEENVTDENVNEGTE
jgi:large subunit ribosomal protein L30